MLHKTHLIKFHTFDLKHFPVSCTFNKIKYKNYVLYIANIAPTSAMTMQKKWKEKVNKTVWYFMSFSDNRRSVVKYLPIPDILDLKILLK